MVEALDEEILRLQGLHRNEIRPIIAYITFNTQEGKERFLHFN